MKTIPVRDGLELGFSTVSVLKQVVCSPNPSGNGYGVEELRDRIKVLDAVEKPGDTITVTDEVHTKLCDMLRSFRFAIATRELLQIIDDVLNAEEAKGSKAH